MKGRNNEVIGRVTVAAILAIAVAASLMWQGCSKDPVTPRKSLVGTWEVVTFKVDGVEEELGYEMTYTFADDHTGYAIMYDGYDYPYSYEWSVEGDSLSIITDVVTSIAWYSCSADCLTLRAYDDYYDGIYELILARVEEE